MNKEKPNQLLATGEIIGSTVRSDEFLKNKKQSRHLGARAVLAMAAEEMARHQVEQNNGYDTPETLQRKIVGVLPAWLKSQAELDTRRSKMSREEKYAALGPAIEINHVLREMIDREVLTTIPEAMEFTSEVMLYLKYSPQEMSYAREKIRMILEGMRHEIVSESVIANLPHVYDVRGGNDIESEMRGEDITVTYDNGSKKHLDIKSTEEAAKRANGKNRRPGYNAVWSGFTREDFGIYLIPPEKVMERKGKYLAREVENLRRDSRGVAA